MAVVVRVKICGITNLRDALAAAEAGADALGFNFWKGSLRYISPGSARKILRQLPPMVIPVGLFVNERSPTVAKVVRDLGLKAVQFHGDETPGAVRALAKRGITVIKALTLGDGFKISELKRFADAELFLLDAAVPGRRGGTGKLADWRKARRVVRETARHANILLAGGLTPGNVTRAVKAVRPFGVDVSSGVERRPGIKSISKMREFIQRAKAAGR